MPARIVALSSLLFALACEEGPPGRKLAAGLAQNMVLAPGAVAFLLDAAHPDDRAVPEDLLAGEVWLAALEGKGAAKKVASGVSSSPGSFAFSKGGEELAVLSGWRFRAGEGELWIATVAGEPVQIAAAAKSFAWSPAEPALAYVSPNRLGLRRPGGREGLSLAIDGLQDIAWSPDGKQIAARSAAAAGGKLWLVDVGSGAKREVAPGTSDFAFAPDGALAALGPPPAKGGDRPLLLVLPEAKEIRSATAFAFSPDGKELALLSTAKQPGEATGELFRASRAGGEAQLLGQKVSDWRFGPGGDLLFLARYDLRARAGALTVASPGAGPRELAAKVQSYVTQGRRVLYLVQAPQKGDFKIELWAADLGSGRAPRKIDEGVYGWQLSPDGGTLYYKARCAGGPRSCSLLREPMESMAPTFLAANVAGFDLSEDGTRVLLQQPHRGATRAVDLAVIPALGAPPARVKTLVEEVDAGSRFADPQGRRVVFATVAPGKSGVYVTDVP